MSHVYSFLDVAAAIVGPGGSFSLGSEAGAAEEGITITPTEEFNTMQIGADGTGQHSLHGGKSGRVTVRLLKTSPVNKMLMAMSNFQRASSSAHGRNTIVVNDTERGDLVTCRQVAFVKVPDLNFQKVAGLVEWIFDAIYVDSVLGE